MKKEFLTAIFILLGLSSQTFASPPTNITVEAQLQLHLNEGSATSFSSPRQGDHISETNYLSEGATTIISEKLVSNEDMCGPFDNNKAQRSFGGYALGAVSGVVLALLVVAISQKWKLTHNAIRCIELSLMMVLLGLILFGAYHLINQLTGNVKELNTLQFCDGVSDDIQKAYAQLSAELQQWLTLFAVMGTFLGMVLPVGGYLLQLKAVEQKEEDMDRHISEKMAMAEKTIAWKITAIWHHHIGVCEWLAMRQQGVVRARLEQGWNKKFSIGAMGLLTWFAFILGCAYECDSENDFQYAVGFVLDSLERLKEGIDEGVWKQFTEDLRDMNKDMKLRIRIDRNKLDKSSYDKLSDFAQEFGM